MTDRLTIILQGDCVEQLRTLPGESVNTCVTSPPYWGLRDYGVEGQIGLERTPEEYVAKMVEVFREVRRVLRGDGTCWVNLGDCYVAAPQGRGKDKDPKRAAAAAHSPLHHASFRRDRAVVGNEKHRAGGGLRPKNLVGIPWRVAFALQSDGWYLRSDIIWHKPNPIPESVTDRPTKSHEYIFLLSKSERYYFDQDAIREECQPDLRDRLWGFTECTSRTDHKNDLTQGMMQKPPKGFVRMSNPLGRNKRSVWTVPTAPFSDCHFAAFPPDLIKPCILAGCPVGGTVLDPFLGSGTTAMVALELGRCAIGIELNPDYIKLAEQRTSVTPGLMLS